MDLVKSVASLLFFPSGIFLIVTGLLYQWVDRKVLARFQNRIGPRWFQPVADNVKLLAKEEVIPDGVNDVLFNALPILALAGALTAALYTPLFGLQPIFSFQGDLIVALYLLSLLTMCIGLAGANTFNRFSLVGALRTFTQLFAYEAPFILALLTPAVVVALDGADTGWQISELAAALTARPWLVLTLPLAFFVALVGLMGKLELPPFDAPEAETEIVAGALTEYSGRGLAIFNLARAVELVVGLTLVTALYLGGLDESWLGAAVFNLKILGLLLVVILLQSLMARLRIDQTVSLWWRYGALALLLQWIVLLLIWRAA